MRRRANRVLLLLQDTPEFLYSFFGVIKIGAVAVPANTLLKPHEYEYLLNDAGRGVVLVSGALLPQLRSIPRERLEHLREIVVVRTPHRHQICLADLMDAESVELEPEPTSEDDVAFWLYSSGSTGLPKGRLHGIAIWWCVPSCTPRIFFRWMNATAVTASLDCFLPMVWGTPDIFLWPAGPRPFSLDAGCDLCRH